VRAAPSSPPVLCSDGSRAAQIAGKLIRQYLPELLGTSLEAMSSLESATLQYLQLHSNAGSSMYNISLSAEQLESECHTHRSGCTARLRHAVVSAAYSRR
jgi:hypothetical protein